MIIITTNGKGLRNNNNNNRFWGMYSCVQACKINHHEAFPLPATMPCSSIATSAAVGLSSGFCAQQRRMSTSRALAGGQGPPGSGSGSTGRHPSSTTRRAT